jgi:hypothetical protein
MWAVTIPRPINPPNALLARFGDDGPQFKVCDRLDVMFWRFRGWFLLADEKEIRLADLDDTRREDERGPKR